MPNFLCNKWIKFFEQKCCTFNNLIEIVKISSTFKK